MVPRTLEMYSVTMATSSILLLCVLVICSVCTVQVRHLDVKTDDDDEEEQVELSMETARIPGVCGACKLALRRVKKVLGKNATKEVIKSKLLSICNKIGPAKSICKKLVTKHLAVLIEELTTSDGVTTICVKAKACKPRELAELFQSDFRSEMEMTEHA